METNLHGQLIQNEAVLRKLKGYMGLATRARQCVFGMDGCLSAMRSGEAALLLVEETISPGSLEKYRAAQAVHAAAWAMLPPSAIHAATGKPGVAMVLKHGGLADAALTLLQGAQS